MSGQDDYWSENLLPAKLDGVEFLIGDREVETGRMFARYKYPFRNGQGVEDTGRKVYIFHLTIPLFRGIAEALYPATYDKLQAINDDDIKKAEVEYQDPELGPIQVKIDVFKWSTSPGARNGGMLTLVLEEIGFEQSLTQNLSKPQFAKRTLASQLALRIDFAIDQLDRKEDMFKKPDGENFSLSEMWEQVQAGLDAGALATDDIAAQIDEVTLVGQKFLNFSARDEIERWSITNAVVDFLGAIEDVGNESAGETPELQMITVELPDTMSMYDIAQWRYGDTSRAEEISFNNPTANVLAYPRGSMIRVFAQ